MKTCPKCGQTKPKIEFCRYTYPSSEQLKCASCNFEMRSKREKSMSRDDLMKKHVLACKEAFKKIGVIS
jgi:hypothetical protein